MHKLLILIDKTAETEEFLELWPKFLSLAESMPGLQREATTRVNQVLFGKLNCSLIHELFFEDAEALYHAMLSPEGVYTGQLLQYMTGGRMILLMADHREDEGENLKKYRQAPAAPVDPAE
ncbi:MAG: hypothetical protein MUC85_01310 [Anaerolineales bacterium]|jgi:hypothetical protein|nr:hypothetical protein [Anaerolineales bacterium]